MQTEVIDVTIRCRECGMARAVFLRDEGLSEDGSRFVAYRTEAIPHTRDACQRMVTLQREEWPTLW